jgi:hypothetical protein
LAACQAADGSELLTVQVVEGCAERNAIRAHQGAVEDGVLRQVGIAAGAELGTNVIDVDDELALHLPDQIRKTVTVEVGPDEGPGDAALVAGEKSASRWGLHALVR